MTVGAGKNLTPKRPARGAFSLIELIVVIGILTVLIGLLLPVLGRVRESAKLAACASNVRQIVTLLRVYTTANDGRLPYQMINYDDWSGVIAPLGHGQRAFTCPADESPRRDTPGYTAVRSYGINNGPFTADKSILYHAPWPAQRDALPNRMHQVRHQVILVGDNHGQFAQSAAYVGIGEAEALDGIAWGSHRMKNRRGDNYGFADGHVEFRLKEELDLLVADPAFDPAGSPRDPWKWR